VIFALVLQGIALAVGTGHLVANAAGHSDWGGFEICQHKLADAGGNGASPGSAPEHPDTSCCIFCLGGVIHALEAPLLSAEFHVVVLETAPPIFTAWRRPGLTVNASARPRGPPLAA
jgi:hypothetical protein